jgi:hypothetical protein
LTGVVKDLGGPNILGNYFLILSGAGGMVLGVECQVNEKEPWKKALPDQTVRLQGKYPEINPRPGLIDCEIVEVTGAGPPTLTADQLAKEYGTDPDGTTAKYDKKYLIVTGEIANVDFNEAKAASITLKTKEQVLRVFCNFTVFAKEQTSRLKPGQKIKVLGEYTLNLDNKKVGLFFSILLEPLP